ncbi:hypothetical protein ACFZCK_04460 [Kitasatospora purpeofusca]|uniref:hypothetical protein n=1 Tax=Kitasatospora purpeofusca TaxID=67352 RepID=UPI0036EAEE27
MTAPAHQPGTEPSAPPQPPTADPGSSLITQDTLSRLLAREKSQGERSAVKKLAADLGFADVSALTAWVEAQRTAQQAALSEVERREQAAEQRERAAEQREQAAFERLRAAERHTALARLGAVGDNLSDAVRLLDVADDADQQAVADAAEALKARRPELFGPAAPATPPPAPSGSPAGGPPQRGQAPAAVNAGLAMARRRGHVQPPA